LKKLNAHFSDVSPAEAKKIQLQLRDKIIQQNDFKNVKTIAGVDVSFSTKSSNAVAGIVILTYPEMGFVEKKVVKGRITFPYIPGLLAFREGPLIEKLFQKLSRKPDITLFDGHGIAHPHGCGIASHLGVLLNISAIGCAKSKLTGEYDMPADKRGAESNLLDKKGILIGKVLRSRAGCKPVFVSIGHKVDLITAVKITLQSCLKFRIPEAIRQTHAFVNKVRLESL
tara:strand:+ start:10839 stop:11519 length:681 start_codon:yes stop_codon:yes gene_type:complete